MTDIPIGKIDWRPCFRIMSSRFPPINLFEAVANPANLETVVQTEAMTNEGRRGEAGPSSS
jgi:hypothetical protein